MKGGKEIIFEIEGVLLVFYAFYSEGGGVESG